MANKKVKVTYYIQKTEEIDIDIPDGAQIQAMEIDGKPILMQGSGEVSDLAQILSGLGVNAIKIGNNEIPIPAILHLAGLLPDLLGKLGIEIK